MRLLLNRWPYVFNSLAVFGRFIQIASNCAHKTFSFVCSIPSTLYNAIYANVCARDQHKTGIPQYKCLNKRQIINKWTKL